MVNTSKLYVRCIYDRFSYLATWLPNTNLKLGDVGFRDGEYFKHMTSLTDLKIPYATRHGNNPIDFTYTSQSGVKMKTKAAGELAAGTTLPLAKAGIVIEFSKEGAFIFQAAACLVDEIEDKIGVGQAIMKLHKKGKWDSNWAVVDTVVKASSATVVVSNSNSAALELSAKAPVAIANLAKPELGLTINSQRGEVLRLLATKGLTPLFKLSRLKKSVLSPTIYFGGKAPTKQVSSSSRDDMLEVVAPD